MLFGTYPFFCSLLGSVFLPGGCLHKLVSALCWHSAPALAGQAVQPWQVLTVRQCARSSAAAQVLMGLFSAKSEAAHGFVCFVHHCRKGSANPSGGERVICSDVNLEVKVRSGIPRSSSPLLAESCHGLV